MPGQGAVICPVHGLIAVQPNVTLGDVVDVSKFQIRDERWTRPVPGEQRLCWCRRPLDIIAMEEGGVVPKIHYQDPVPFQTFDFKPRKPPWWKFWASR